MATKVILPILGQTMEEGTITKWLKQEGDEIRKGEPLYEVMTDKVNMEVESPESGILRKIIAKQDETIPVMAMIGIIGSADETIDSLLAEAGGEKESTATTSPADIPKSIETAVNVPQTQPAQISRLLISPRAKKLAKESGIPLEVLAGHGTGPQGRIVEKDVRAYIAQSAGAALSATPLASKVAADKGIALGSITGTGPGGKIVRQDVLQAAERISAPSAIEAGAIPFAGMRKMVADNVTKSAQTAPHVTLTTEADMTEAVKMREQAVEQFEQKYGSRLTYTDLIVKAAALAITAHPIINATLKGNEILISSDVNIGIAAAVEGGLVVPVVHNADRKSVAQISVESKGLIDKARANKLAASEITGGTFTITNLGAYGIDVFNPIITPGQSAILGVCRIAKKPVIFEEQVTVRSMMNLCLSFDHRVMDGAPAAQFLKKVKDYLEAPYLLLI